MNMALWVVQGLLALLFLMAGSMKAFTPLASMRKKMTWANGFPAAFVRFLGVAELLGAIGLIAPAVTGIQSWLTVAAAVGFVVVMVSASSSILRDFAPGILAYLLSCWAFRCLSCWVGGGAALRWGDGKVSSMLSE